MTDCLCGSDTDCNPQRLLKLSMICSHPDSTLGILLNTGLLKTDSEEYLEGVELVKLEGFTDGEEIPEEDDPRKGKTLYLDPGTGGRMDGPWGLSDEGLDTYYKICYFVVLCKYKAAHCLDESAYEQLYAWVDGDGFLDKTGKEYVDIVNAIKAIQ